MSNLERFTVSMDQRLLKQFDELNKKKGYANRSESIRDLIRERLVSERWEFPSKTAHAAATVTIVYDPHTSDLSENLNHLQHDQGDLVVSTLHVHLGHHSCLETIVLRGTANEVKRLADRLIALKGVKHGKAVLTVEGEDLP
ncbi:MAG TPA: nickel-responsive transcriptional regulator NikR [Candidatus Sumerlaeota bacterium]|nr:nickel-responsive transcriptional regulator NikR [Candidatus Sumerlaeota bacterium]